MNSNKGGKQRQALDPTMPWPQATVLPLHCPSQKASAFPQALTVHALLSVTFLFIILNLNDEWFFSLTFFVSLQLGLYPSSFHFYFFLNSPVGNVLPNSRNTFQSYYFTSKQLSTQLLLPSFLQHAFTWLQDVVFPWFYLHLLSVPQFPLLAFFFSSSSFLNF